ncbi:hypothetical protein ACR2V0_28535, partial [Klebsiella pneumoniae]
MSTGLSWGWLVINVFSWVELRKKVEEDGVVSVWDWGCHQKFDEVGVDVKIVVFSLFVVVELG